MITPGEKIAILMPSVFFIVLVIIKSVSDARLAYDLKMKLNISNESMISEIINPNASWINLVGSGVWFIGVSVLFSSVSHIHQHVVE